jgi:hypothetical protein
LFNPLAGAFAGWLQPVQGVYMKRHAVNKANSAKQFRRNVSRTKAANLPATMRAEAPMRGGWRL